MTIKTSEVSARKVRRCPHCGSPLTFAEPAAASEITPRQTEVLRMIAMGLSAREIGEKLKISPRTVEFHRAMIIERLDLHSTAQLTIYAIERQLV